MKWWLVKLVLVFGLFLCWIGEVKAGYIEDWTALSNGRILGQLANAIGIDAGLYVF